MCPSLYEACACSPTINAPYADIAGANDAHWRSVLVLTGVYNPTHGPPRHTPTHIAEDVEEAVSWAIEREARALTDGSQVGDED